MTGTQGQASVEWVGLLSIIAIVGAGIALVAGPPFAAAIRGAIVAALAGRTAPGPVTVRPPTSATSRRPSGRALRRSRPTPRCSRSRAGMASHGLARSPA